jgi:membrane protein YdbS with pleckstrin-like domain
LVFLLFVFPWILLVLIPELGWTYVALFLLGNGIWMLIVHILLPLYYRSISYEMTDEEVIVRKGIITKTENIVPYRTVTNVSVKRGPIDRILNMGTLEIHTAGYSEQVGSEAKLGGLEDYARVQQDLLTALRRYRAEIGTLEPSTPAAPAAAGRGITDGHIADLLREIRDEVRAIREREV